jgi:hypothetical protein
VIRVLSPETAFEEEDEDEEKEDDDMFCEPESPLPPPLPQPEKMSDKVMAQMKNRVFITASLMWIFKLLITIINL